MSLLYTDNDWDFEKLARVDKAIQEIAFGELGLDCYPNRIEIISADQMLDAYSSHGMPMMYSHWSFGKNFILEEHNYRHGHSGLAYEIVLNTSPVLNYLMEENSMTMQALVIAHAAYGHNSFFKNNYLFKQNTDAETIIDYLAFAKNYIAKCEEKHGAREVEIILDAAHSIMSYGVDRYTKPTKLTKNKAKERQLQREEQVQAEANALWSHVTNTGPKERDEGAEAPFPLEPEENILYFIEKYSPSLESWEREVVRIVRKISQYFYPQIQTKVMNEGWASFIHHHIMNRLWERGQISDGNYLEFIHSHSGVLRQLDYSHPSYNGYNPYALGFAIFSDIKRICSNPTDEDKHYFPNLIGLDWLTACKDAVANYRDESFISQFLSPKVMRDWGMFEITNNEADSFVSITGIHNESDYNRIRQSLSQQYSTTSKQPDIQVTKADLKSMSRTLTLTYTPHNKNKLHPSFSQVISHIETLWGYRVDLIGN